MKFFFQPNAVGVARSLMGPLAGFLLCSTALAQGVADIDITSPVDHNSANPYVFVSFVVKNTQALTDPGKTGYAIVVNDGQFFVQASTAGSFCSSDSNGLPAGTFAETCGCYFDLRQVDTNRSKTHIAVHYQNYDSGTNLEGRGNSVFLPNSGPVRPPATSPMCPPANTSTDLQPFPIVGADKIVTGAAMVSLDGSASYDPEDTPLSYAWSQISGPTVAINGASTPTPSFGITNVITPTELVFQLVVIDQAGTGRSAAANTKVTVMPPANANTCSPWNRDRLIESLTAVQSNGPGSNYSLKNVITGQASTDLQSEAARLATIYSNFETLEIKSYISAAGTDVQPNTGAGAVSGASPKSRLFETPVSPAPQLYWMGEPFAENTWYRLDTKLNVKDSNGYFIGTNDTYADDCLYETVYVKLDPNGDFGMGLRSGGPQLVFSNGTSMIDSVSARPNGSVSTPTTDTGAVVISNERIGIGRGGVRIAKPGDAEDVVITPESLKDVKKKAKRGWRIWKKSKEKETD